MHPKKNRSAVTTVGNDRKDQINTVPRVSLNLTPELSSAGSSQSKVKQKAKQFGDDNRVLRLFRGSN